MGSEMTSPTHSVHKWPWQSWRSSLLTFGSGLFPFPNSHGAGLLGKSGLQIPLSVSLWPSGSGAMIPVWPGQGRSQRGEFPDFGHIQQGRRRSCLTLQTFRSCRPEPSLTALSLQGVNHGGKTGWVYRKDMRKRKGGNDISSASEPEEKGRAVGLVKVRWLYRAQHPVTPS